MRKVKKAKIGELVLISKFDDIDIADSWFIGELCEIRYTRDRILYMVEYPKDGVILPSRYCKNLFLITNDEAEKIMDNYNEIVNNTEYLPNITIKQLLR